MSASIEFIRRIGPDPHANGARTYALRGCPDILELEGGDFAVIGSDITAEAIGNPIDFGALLSLAQHHGFPTPLLDWSKSPYIAAFFALRNRTLITEEDDYSRIYVFNALAWRQDNAQAAHLADPRPVITPLEFVAHNNPRHLPQQSVHTFTNIEDPEAWIRMVEKGEKKYLIVIDISRSECKFAMQDLAYMGVTAATLFPGLDGICESLKEKYF